jgi:hypothetical protein
MIILRLGALGSMRKQVLRLLREHFKRELESGGKFLLATEKRGSADSDVYVWKLSEDLTFFVYLLPNPKSYRDTFMVELGWSKGPSFPRHEPLTNKQRLDVLHDGRIRLPSLWRDQWKSALEPWWEAGSSISASTREDFYAEEETVRRVAEVPRLVADAMDKLQEHGIPLFQRIVAERETRSRR